MLTKGKQTAVPMHFGLSVNEREMARKQGLAVGDALDHMIAQVADDGQEKRVGPYLVSYAVTAAEGWYVLSDDDKLLWQTPAEANIYLQITVRDAVDGRFVPQLSIQVHLFNQQGDKLGQQQHPFVWHPWVYHYGCHWRVKEDGRYLLEIMIKAPEFPRQAREEGTRYSQDVRVIFSSVKISQNN